MWSSRDGKALFLLGGLGVDANGVPDVLLQDWWRWDVSSATWTLVGGSMFGNARATPLYPGARRGASVWNLGNGSAVMFGGDGYDATTRGVLSDMWILHEDRHRVERLGGPATVNVPASAWPGARRGAQAFVASGCGDALHLWGGFGLGEQASEQGDLADMWSYSGGAWTRVAGPAAVYPTTPASTPAPRSDGAVWATGGCAMRMFGGWGFDTQTQRDRIYDDVWSFDCASRSWTLVAAAGGPAARFGAAAWVEADTLHIMGGVGVDGRFTADHWSLLQGRFVQVSEGDASTAARAYAAAWAGGTIMGGASAAGARSDMLTTSETSASSASSTPVVVAVVVVVCVLAAAAAVVGLFLLWRKRRADARQASPAKLRRDVEMPTSPSSPTPLMVSSSEANELRRQRNSAEEQQDLD